MSVAAVLDRSRRDVESWRYTNLEKLLALPATRPAKILPASATSDGCRLSFINGIFQPQQSQFGDLPQELLQGDAQNGYRLELASQTCLVTMPVELIFTGDEKAGQETATKLSIILGASTRLTLIERHENAAAAQVTEIDIRLHAQAKLVHGKLIKATAPHLAMTKVRVEAGAFYDQFTLIQGGPVTRNEIEVSLDGKMAQCALNAAMLLRGRDHADITTRITHAAPHGTSREMVKSVIDGQARGVFQGKIMVAKDAQKTDSAQLSRALLLSDQAEIDAKPELEIYADDVKCSHGCTVGDLDEDALFYLRTRGLDETAARALLIKAFVGEILDEIHSDAFRDLCRAETEGWLHEQA